MKSPISFSKAVEGYLLAVSAGHLSEHTIRDYGTTFRKFFNYLDEDIPIAEITEEQVRSFLAAQTVSKKTVLNYHSGLNFDHRGGCFIDERNQVIMVDSVFGW